MQWNPRDDDGRPTEKTTREVRLVYRASNGRTFDTRDEADGHSWRLHQARELIREAGLEHLMSE